jgi:serine/threonine-protein kinase RsbW
MKHFGIIQKTAKGVFPARFIYLASIREFIVILCKKAGFGQDVCYQVELAVDEACSNIIEHAYGGESDKKNIECLCVETESAFLIQLHDEGKSFNPELVPKPKLTASLEERESGGLGLHFMRQYMDDVIYQKEPVVASEKNSPRKGNYLLLVKIKE